MNLDIKDEDLINEVREGAAVLAVSKIKGDPVAVVSILDPEGPSGVEHASIVLDRIGLLRLLERTATVLGEINDEPNRTRT